MQVYADNAATTKISNAALQAMMPAFETYYGNPSSLHSVGQEAKELLENTNMSIAEISSRLHFDCIGQFSTFFKKKTGTPPLEYRKNGIKKD
jgi:selenocysteine lyase/cysteine desulfurase